MAGLLSLFRGKKDREPKCAAIIVSAGLARRMGGIDKVLAPLGELPVLVHTLYAFQDCPVVEEIVVVAREDLLVEVGRICKDFVFDKVTKVVVGGEEPSGPSGTKNGLVEYAIKNSSSFARSRIPSRHAILASV